MSDATRVILAVERFVKKHKVTSPEAVYQVDSIMIACPELVIELCDIVGWHRLPDEERLPDEDE